MAEPFDKPYALIGEPTERSVYEIDEMFEQLYRRLASVQTRVDSAFPEDQSVNLSEWKVGRAGPWTLDDIIPSTARAVIAPTALAASTEYADFAPEGIDTCIELHITLAGSGSSISGVRNFGRISRKIAVVNNDATNNLTITHAGANSTARHRFALPGDTDVILSPYQVAWMSYNTSLQRWQLMITPHDTGGLNQSSSVVLRSELDISDATYRLFNSATPVVLEQIAATAGKIICPLYWSLDVNTSSVYTNTPSLSLNYDDRTSANPVVGTIPTQTNAVRHHFNWRGSPNSGAAFTENTAARFEGTNMVLAASATPTGTGTTKMKSVILYTLADVQT